MRPQPERKGRGLRDHQRGSHHLELHQVGGVHHSGLVSSCESGAAARSGLAAGNAAAAKVRRRAGDAAAVVLRRECGAGDLQRRVVLRRVVRLATCGGSVHSWRLRRRVVIMRRSSCDSGATTTSGRLALGRLATSRRLAAAGGRFAHRLAAGSRLATSRRLASGYFPFVLTYIPFLLVRRRFVVFEKDSHQLLKRHTTTSELRGLTFGISENGLTCVAI